MTSTFMQRLEVARRLTAALVRELDGGSQELAQLVRRTEVALAETRRLGEESDGEMALRGHLVAELTMARAQRSAAQARRSAEQSSPAPVTLAPILF